LGERENVFFFSCDLSPLVDSFLSPLVVVYLGHLTRTESDHVISPYYYSQVLLFCLFPLSSMTRFFFYQNFGWGGTPKTSSPPHSKKFLIDLGKALF
jgi:hypothetical protein